MSLILFFFLNLVAILFDEVDLFVDRGETFK